MVGELREADNKEDRQKLSTVYGQPERTTSGLEDGETTEQSSRQKSYTSYPTSASATIEGRNSGYRERTDRSTQVDAEPTAQVIQEAPAVKRKRGRPSKSKFVSKQEAEQISDFVLSFIEGFAVNTYGEKAKYNDFESLLLKSSLPQMLSQLETSTLETTSKVLAPLAVIAGFGAYAIRIMQMEQDKRKKKQENNEKNVSENGKTGDTPISEDRDIWSKQTKAGLSGNL